MVKKRGNNWRAKGRERRDGERYVSTYKYRQQCEI